MLVPTLSPAMNMCEKVSVLRQPWVGVGGEDPLEAVHGVFPCGGELGLPGDAVFHGHDEDAGLESDGIDEVDLVGRGGGLVVQQESTAVVVDEDWNLLVGCLGRLGKVEAGSHVGSRVDDDVFGFHAGDGVEAGQDIVEIGAQGFEYVNEVVGGGVVVNLGGHGYNDD